MNIFKRKAKAAFKTEHWHWRSWDSLPSPPRNRTQCIWLVFYSGGRVGGNRGRKAGRERTVSQSCGASYHLQNVLKPLSDAAYVWTNLWGGDGALCFDILETWSPKLPVYEGPLVGKLWVMQCYLGCAVLRGSASGRTMLRRSSAIFLLRLPGNWILPHRVFPDANPSCHFYWENASKTANSLPELRFRHWWPQLSTKRAS